MAHATLRAWLKPSSKASIPPSSPITTPHHLIFTASLLSFFTLAGYAPYSPTKAALRSLSDTLSQEMNLYKASCPVRLHTIYPATIFTESYEAENKVKSDLTKKLEEGDAGQTADEVARRSIAGLERGEEMVTTTFMTRLLMTSVLGGTIRNGWAVLDTVFKLADEFCYGVCEMGYGFKGEEVGEGEWGEWDEEALSRKSTTRGFGLS